jgi:hypothetical protein
VVKRAALVLWLLPAVAAAQETRMPLSIAVGLDPPAGTGALSLGIESRGWGAGVGFGLSDAKPGDLHQHVSLFVRAPIVRLGPVDLGALVTLARADRESEILYADHPSLGHYLRWEWRPAYRVGLALSARLAQGPWAERLDVGLAYALNAPRCQYLAPAGMFVGDASCDDPRIPAEENATDAKGRLAPWVALVGEYDLVTPAAPAPEQGPERTDGRETNAGLAPTALTLPAGSVRVTLYELVFPELAVGITNRLQVSGGLSYLPPRGVVDLLYRAEIKLRVLDVSRLHVAITGELFGYTGQYDTNGNYVGPGAVASVCLDERCESLLSASAWATFAWIDPDEGLSYRDRDLLLSPSAVVAVLPRLKVGAELHWAVDSHDDPFALAFVRIPLRHLIVEVGSTVGPFFPVGSLSWRF